MWLQPSEAALEDIDHGRSTIRVASVLDDDRGAGLPEATGDPGRRRHRTPRSPAQRVWRVQELRDGRRSFAHRGSGFGPVAVTSRCGTQSSTWTKPSNVAPWRMTPSYSDRR